MNLRLVQFNLGPGRRPAAQAIADQIVPAIRAQKGCERCEFYGNEASGDYGLVALWTSVQAADAASSVISPMLHAAVTTAEAKGRPSIRLFEVYEPKG